MAVNIFERYKQEENHFTNSLVALLSLSKFHDSGFLPRFLRECVGIAPIECVDVESFRVLKGFNGTADAELRGGDCRIWFETKIESGALCDDQIDRHLKELCLQPERSRTLILLTPDDGESRYIKDIIARYENHPCHLRHVGWKELYEFLENSVKDKPDDVYTELVRQFLKHIHYKVFMQDIAGIIGKIQFGDKSQVYQDRYLDEMKKWTQWDTPREYKKLDGKGRKLLLYDSSLQGITLEVEIKEVKPTGKEPDYPWANYFAEKTMQFFNPPIPLCDIRQIDGFAGFGRERGAYRNLTQMQYRRLMELYAVSKAVK